MSTAAQRAATAERSRRWRALNPERSRELTAKYRARNPLTPEARAHKAEVNRKWRAKNAAKIRRTTQAKRQQINARRRELYAQNSTEHRARNAAWKAAHPDHNRVFYRRHREKFTGNGPWSNHTKKRRTAWRKFTQTCAANRAITQEIAP